MFHVQIPSARAAPSVSDEPSTCLLQWRVIELSDGKCVLVGILPERPAARITTPIVDWCGRDVVTASGRRYELVGRPAIDVDVLDVFREHLQFLGHASWRDVTHEHVVAAELALVERCM